MPDYRLYCLGAGGKIAKAEWIEAKSDDEAIVLVRVKKMPFDCELWRGDQMIERISAFTPTSG